MAFVTDETIREVAEKLGTEIYEADFRGKGRGRFAITRAQLRHALGVQKLHATTIERLQHCALEYGLVIIDLDDLFPCVETNVVREYRRPPKSIFSSVFGSVPTTEPDED
jgi:hypothetical protein